MLLRDLPCAPNRSSRSPSWALAPGNRRGAARSLPSRLRPRTTRRGSSAERDEHSSTDTPGQLRSSAPARVRPGQARDQAAAARGPMLGGRGAGAAGRALTRRRWAPRARPGRLRAPVLSAPSPAASRPGRRRARRFELQWPPPPPQLHRLFIFPERRRRGGPAAGRGRGRGRGREGDGGGDAAPPSPPLRRPPRGMGARRLERARRAPPLPPPASHSNLLSSTHFLLAPPTPLPPTPQVPLRPLPLLLFSQPTLLPQVPPLPSSRALRIPPPPAHSMGASSC